MTAKQRVELELEDLNEKRQKLSAFFATPIFARLGSTSAKLLRMQADAMSLYANILSLRLSTWEEVPVERTPLEALADEVTCTTTEEDDSNKCRRCGRDVRNCTCEEGWL